jgi:hypothetical protein
MRRFLSFGSVRWHHASSPALPAHHGDGDEGCDTSSSDDRGESLCAACSWLLRKDGVDHGLEDDPSHFLFVCIFRFFM